MDWRVINTDHIIR